MEWPRNSILLLFLLIGELVSTVCGQAKPPDNKRVRMPDFPYTDGWLGADDAYSVPIAANKSIWLFGDTFVANRDTNVRGQYKVMVRNSVGISDCDSQSTCSIRYFWRNPYTTKARSFFDTGTDDEWYWPMDGFRRGKILFVPLMAVRNKPHATPQDVFGFEIAGTKLATIDNAEIPPADWHVTIRSLTGPRLWAGVSMIPDGNYVLWYTRVAEDDAHGYMAVMRVPQDRMVDPSAFWEYLRQDGEWIKGPAGADAKHVIEQPISEMSVRYHPSIHKWLALSAGPEFPSKRAVARLAASPIGPWSDPQTLYEFPEMKPDTPGYDKDTFCYAVKEHVEFTDTRVAMTYACNSVVIAKVVADMKIYRPKVVVLDLPK